MTETVRIEIPIETVDNTEPEMSNVTKKFDKMDEAVKKIGTSTEKARKKVTKFDESAEKTQKNLSKWVKEKYEILLEAKERITPILQVLRRGIRSISSKTWHVTMRAVDFVTAPVRGIINLFKNPIFQVGAVLGVSIGLKDTIDTYKDFEAAMSKVSAVSGAIGTDLVKLTDKAKEMGATTKFTATETAEGFNYMAMAGWKTKDMLDGIEGILSLAAASGEDLGTTSDIVTDALTAFKLQAKDSGHFADVLAAASSNANTNVSMLGESFKYVAPVAGAMKYSVEDVSLALGLMANASVKSSMSGTSLKTAIANMSAPTDKMQAAMKKYNISLTDNHSKMKTLKGVLDNIRNSLGNLSEAEQTAAAKNIFGKEAMAGMLSIVNASEKDYNKLAKAINNADGASAKMSDTMLDNLQGSITLFQSALDGVKLSFGERLSPYVKGASDWLTDMMPSIEFALDELMNYTDRKIEKLKLRFKEISSTAEWKNASIFGKGKIAWDEFIVTPFMDWWNNEGKAKIAKGFGDFSELLGSGLHNGILALLGFDISDTLNEGASIGASFAKGFAEGFDFDEISSKLWDGFKNILGNASKLLPGGESATLSSLLSLGLLAKIAGPLLRVGSGGVKLGKALLGTETSSLVGSMLGSAANGSGILGFGANTAIGLGAGNLAGGASLSAGVLSAVGLGSVAGGVAGATGLVHGGMDLYEGFTANDEKRASAYKTAGAIEVGGVATGAAAGAAIGSVVPVLGTATGALIGAGIGAIGSWIAGNKIKEQYEEDSEEILKTAENAKKVYQITGQSIDNVRFKTEALNKAMNDSEVSVEEFSQMYQESVTKNLSKHFGDVSLSLSEIKKIADDVVFSVQAKKLKEYSNAAEKTAESLASLESNMSTLEKENWKAGLGNKLDTINRENYKSAADSFLESAKAYIENQHYETTLAVELIADKKNASNIISGLDDAYSDVEKQLEELGKKLTQKIEKALEDGVVNAKEEKAIAKLQNKIQKLTKQSTEAKDQASLNTMKIKFGNGKLDSTSFASLQEELANNTQSASQTYEEALKAGLEGLNLMKPNLKKGKYEEMYSKLKEEYESKIKALNDRNVDFQLEMIVDTYGRELDGILPEFTGTTQEKLKQAMEEAFLIRPDATKWTQADIIDWFGLDSLTGETQGAMIQLIQMLATSVPDSAKEVLKNEFKDTIPTLDEIIESVDFTKVSVEDYYKALGLEAPKSAFCKPGESYNPLDGLLTGEESNFEELAKKYAERLQKAFEKNTNPEQMREFMTTYMNSALPDVDQSATEAVTSYGNNIGTGIITGASNTITSSSERLRNAVENTVTSATSSPFTPNVQISPNYTVTPYNFSLLNISGGSSANSGTSSNNRTPTVKNHYNGGYAGSKQLSWLAEEGYGEYIIPTNPSRRQRALELYKQAGNALGVSKYADGGFVTPRGTSYTADNNSAYFTEDNMENESGNYEQLLNPYSGGEQYSYSVGNQDSTATGGVSAIEVNVQVNPEFTITTGNQNSEDIPVIIKRHMREIADEVGGELASQLDAIFSNMPLKEA